VEHQSSGHEGAAHALLRWSGPGEKGPGAVLPFHSHDTWLPTPAARTV